MTMRKVWTNEALAVMKQQRRAFLREHGTRFQRYANSKKGFICRACSFAFELFVLYDDERRANGRPNPRGIVEPRYCPGCGAQARHPRVLTRAGAARRVLPEGWAPHG